MPAIDYYNEHDIAKEIDACFKAQQNLTMWEGHFLLGIEDQVTKRMIISRKQVDTVHRIYLKMFGEKFNNTGESNE